MKNSSVFIIVFVIFFGCSEILFEEEITNYSINLNAPSDGVELKFKEVGFHWDLVEGVDQYNLQIAKPSFEEAEKIILDTIIEGNSYEKELIDGSYEWRVRGLNSAYSTEFSISQFIVDTSG